ncbi:type II toxin-antitoxin system CcdA family antitoxin [Thalassobacter stenotrophicus]|uniref:type II toxin-antitoxin system CcdA family antitoxin n=1 Tax=Thalassobacter stenotrophicus TaxID=266809 RepID=UPI0022A930D6|nr:type II toxin-antitoxin system CcdA family antitoxin [Thalassobacter stenotrophicus]UYP67461.1 type II toxin-antitoxin system CcdA family antitoxin [Thalassobacter stenotrophicus]
MSAPNTEEKAPEPGPRCDTTAEQRAQIWARNNAAAIAERRAWIETEGTPLADMQVLQVI